jgi:hypothetical protein
VNILVFEGQTVKDGMMGKAQAWLLEHESELRSAAPDGTGYLGFYAPIFISAKNPGDLFLVYSSDSYGALDRQAASGDSRWGELLNQWHTTFIDSSPGTMGRKILYKSLTAGTVWGG